MTKIIISENVSLDGVMEDPAGVEGFRLGGWYFQTDRGEDGERFTLDRTLGTEALLLGRRSYEFFAATWPSRGGELADKLNSLPKYVVSSTLEDPDWNNSTVLRGDVVDEVSKLRQELGRGDRRPRQRPARAHADRARPRRRAAADDLPGRARGRRTPLRDDQPQETRAPGRRDRPWATASPSSPTSSSETPSRCRTAPAFRTNARPLSAGRGSGRAPEKQRNCVGVCARLAAASAGPSPLVI